METPIDTEPGQRQPNPAIEATDAAAKYPESAPNSSPSDPNVLRRLYANMLTCRMVRERASTLPGQGRSVGTCRDLAGSEAIDVGATFELRGNDALSLYGRDVVSHILKGESLKQVFRQLLRERKNRNHRPQPSPFLAGDVLPTAPSVAAQFDVAAGVAFAYKQQSQRNVVLTIFADAFD